MNDANQNYIIDEDAIDLTQLMFLVLRSKFTIIIITILFSVSSVFLAIYTPDRYQSSALLQVHSSSQGSMGSSMSSQLGGIAALAGISVNSGDSDKSYYTIETVNSREFLKHLLTFNGVKENLFASISYDKTNGNTVFDKKIFNNKKWVRVPFDGKKSEPSYLEVYKDYIANLSIIKSKKSGYLKISFEHHSPIFAHNFLNLIINEINEVSKQSDIKESERALEYLANQSKNIEQKNIKDSIKGLVDSQLERLMLANIRDQHLVSTIDPPFIAEENFSPSRPIIVILGTIIGFFFSLLIIFLREYLSKRRAE